MTKEKFQNKVNSICDSEFRNRTATYTDDSLVLTSKTLEHMTIKYDSVKSISGVSMRNGDNVKFKTIFGDVFSIAY